MVYFRQEEISSWHSQERREVWSVKDIIGLFCESTSDIKLSDASRCFSCV
jgi:hypothetical protein